MKSLSYWLLAVIFSNPLNQHILHHTISIFFLAIVCFLFTYDFLFFMIQDKLIRNHENLRNLGHPLERCWLSIFAWSPALTSFQISPLKNRARFYRLAISFNMQCACLCVRVCCGYWSNTHITSSCVWKRIVKCSIRKHQEWTTELVGSNIFQKPWRVLRSQIYLPLVTYQRMAKSLQKTMNGLTLWNLISNFNKHYFSTDLCWMFFSWHFCDRVVLSSCPPSHTSIATILIFYQALIHISLTTYTSTNWRNKNLFLNRLGRYIAPTWHR